MMTNTSTSHRPLIIGSLTMDVLLQVPHLPARQQDINIAAQQMKSGGCAYNVYEAVKCCGGQPHFAGVVGKGAFADAVRKEVGHDPHMILFDSDEENGCCYCLVEPDGERTFLCVHGAEYRFRAQWLSQLDPASYGWLYLCGIDLEEAQNACLIQFAIHSGLRLMPFVAARALHGILSASVTFLVLPHLPGDIAVFANGAQPVPMGDANTPVLSICLMMMSALLLMQLPRFQRKR